MSDIDVHVTDVVVNHLHGTWKFMFAYFVPSIGPSISKHKPHPIALLQIHVE